MNRGSFAIFYFLCMALSAQELQKIHLVYMTHLDLGYTDPVHEVCDNYFQNLLPKAAALAEQVEERRRNGFTNASFVWTQYPWLIQEYLDSAAQCGNPARDPKQMALVRRAIEKNQIIWHANALSAFWELADDELFDYSLSLRENLNLAFHKNHGSIVFKNTDVPGISRALIPKLAAHGLKAIHLGYNPVAKMPDVPPVFIWLDKASGKQVLAMIENTYGREVRICNKRICDDEALIFFFKGEGDGIPTLEEVEAFWHALEIKYPNSQIVASSLDEYAAHVLQNTELINSLDIVMDEIGDTWLYGVASDPAKLSQFRETRRAMTEAVAKNVLDASSSEYVSTMRRLMKTPEHNWGLSLYKHFGDLVWENEQFHKARQELPAYRSLEREWDEQRLFNLALSSSPCTNSACRFFATLNEQVARLPSSSIPFLTTTSALADLESEHQCGAFRFRFSATSGALDFLQDRRTGKIWADSYHQLGTFLYRTYSYEEDQRFANESTNLLFEWSKPFLGYDEQAKTIGIYDTFHVSDVKKEKNQNCRFVLTLEPNNAQAHRDFGAPERVLLTYDFQSVPESIGLTLQWENKTSTKHEEAMFLSFVPITTSGKGHWQMDVMGQKVSPQRVATRGARYVHAVWDGVVLYDEDHRLQINALDTPLVCPGNIDNFFRFGGDLPNPNGGMHFNLYNNLWPDAFPQWYGAQSGNPSGIARFVITP